MKKISGNTGGLKATQLRRIENLYHHRIPPESIINPRLVEEICSLSAETRRQIGLLVDRSGRIARVIVGDNQKIMLPDTDEYRTPPGRLKGLRCVHTHLNDEALTRDDLTDLSLLRLDLMAAVGTDKAGNPGQMHAAHILPSPSDNGPHQILAPQDPMNPETNCIQLIRAIEDELSQYQATRRVATGKEKAVLVSVTSASKQQARASLEELKELARSSGIQALDTVLQHRKKINPRFLMGTGKLEELTIHAMQLGATLIIFDQELNPSQMRSITDQIESRVLDRTQLILDIFSQRAQSREGKIQVELAQLKYMLPRLATKNTAMSRLTGGIGGRGPGETKLEINRRRVRDRITRLEKALGNVRKQRHQQKARRAKRGLPIISIIGYTNAGKSTLLNTLTNSSVMAESRLFATLDPSSRRLKFPRDTEVIITDTVGFIKDLPRELQGAFRATLEELESADLLLHVIDGANEAYQAQIDSVNRILENLHLDRIPVINVINKTDLLDRETRDQMAAETSGIPICAKKSQTLHPLIEKMEQAISGSGVRVNEQAASGGFDRTENPILTDSLT
ncbi:MAG: GTPase HflX [Desulfobacteraceae bacterium]|nr:GTPase HflX [Desulfobacteraceae bacterium]